MISIRPVLRGPLLAGVILVGSLLLPRITRGATWHVPSDAPTIQAGINLAQVGDSVLVAPGTYQEHDILMKGGIRVRGEQGPDVTTIDAQNLGRGFTCSDFQDVAAVEGFAIINGRTVYDDGGGIRCVRANLLIQSCLITGCSTQAQGGGIYLEESSVRIVDCEITNNRGEDEGGGVASVRADLAVQDCNVSECYTQGCGGGVAGLDSSIEIVDSAIAGNRAWCGGGVSSIRATQLTMERCVILSNRGLCEAGGIGCFGTFDIADCLIVGNSAMECGVGWALSLSGTGRVAGCTVAANRGHGDSEVILVNTADLSVERTIVAFHDGGDAFVCAYSDATFRCCDVYGNRNNSLCGDDLGGNFSADPLFCDAANGNYTLDGDSPCLPGNHPQGVDCGLIGAHDHGCGVLPPTGACCFADGSCLLVEESVCVDQLGTYMGDGSTCASNPCQPTPAAPMTWGKLKILFR